MRILGNKKFIIFVGVCFVTLFFTYMVYLNIRSMNEFKKERFNGTVEDIKFVVGGRGFPSALIKSEWIYLGMNSSGAYNYVQIGDSIVKKSGSKKISSI